jgi:hypothetical protein
MCLQELQERIIRLLREENLAKTATTDVRYPPSKPASCPPARDLRRIYALDFCPIHPALVPNRSALTRRVRSADTD